MLIVIEGRNRDAGFPKRAENRKAFLALVRFAVNHHMEHGVID